jgi:hypothetical protein
MCASPVRCGRPGGFRHATGSPMLTR